MNIQLNSVSDGTYELIGKRVKTDAKEKNEQTDWKESELLAIGKHITSGRWGKAWRRGNAWPACSAAGGGWTDYDSMAKYVKSRHMRSGLDSRIFLPLSAGP